MSQRTAMQEFTADAFEAFFDAGLADCATYTPPQGGEPQPCTVLVDRGVQTLGQDFRRVNGPQVQVRFQLADVTGLAERGRLDVLMLDDDGVVLETETFELVSRLDQNEVEATWVVRRV